MRKTSQTKVMTTMALVVVVTVVVVVAVVVVVVTVEAARGRKRSWANGTRCCPILLQQAGLD